MFTKSRTRLRRLTVYGGAVLVAAGATALAIMSRIRSVMSTRRGGWRAIRGVVLLAALGVAVVAALVPALGATAAIVSRGGAGLPHTAAHAGFRTQGGGHGPAGRTVLMSSVPASRPGARTAGPVRAMPVGTGTTAARYAALKAAARTSSAAPRPPQAARSAPRPASNAADTPGTVNVFSGQSDSPATCPYFSGCAPPDEALATSSTYEVQLVNTSIDIWKNGAVQAGFPKNLQNFFGVPNPSPAGCDSHGPFLTDPRAAYDSNTGRFYVTAMQIEDGFGVGIGCTALSKVWFAISATSDPTGAWHVYSLAIPGASTTVFSDYTQFGFDTEGLYWSFNLLNNKGSALVSNVVFGIRKAELLTGANFTWWFFAGLNVGGPILDTVQPVQTLDHNAGPPGEIFVNSYNMNFPGAQSGLVVWDFSNIAFSGGRNPSLSWVKVGSDGYSMPPGADDPPTCNACLETLGAQISSTPAYQHGQVYAGLDTAVNNGSGVNVPGILWFDINVYLNPGPAACSLCTTINSSTGVQQQGYYYYGGAADAYFPTLIPNSDGSLTMGFQFSSTRLGVDPSQVSVGRQVTLPPGTMSGSGTYTFRSTTASTQERQGDYAASSWTGASDDTTWSAGEYTCPATGDWCTRIWHNT